MRILAQPWLHDNDGTGHNRGDAALKSVLNQAAKTQIRLQTHPNSVQSARLGVELAASLLRTGSQALFLRYSRNHPYAKFWRHSQRSLPGHDGQQAAHLPDYV